jgi:hypothetical protein
MRYQPSNPDASTATDWGDGVDSPTHLPADAFEIEVARSSSNRKKSSRSRSRSQSRSQSESVVTSAPRPSKVPTLVHEPAPLPEAHSASRSRSARGSQPRPLPAPPAVGATGSQPKLAPAPVAAPAPAPAPVMEQAPAFMEFNGGAAFDPNQLPMPPEVAPAVFGWVRRLALQADLQSADRLLRDAVAELTSSLTVIVIYAGPEGFYTLGPDGELPKDTQPVAAVGKARRALVGPHSGLIPIATATETLAVIQLVRNVRQPAFGQIDHLTMAAIARECAAVLHHLVVQHLQGQLEHAADKKGLYRPEALQHHRKKGSEGVITDLSPRWVKRAYPLLVSAILIALLFGIIVRVPTYSSGFGVVHYDGTPVTSLAQGNLEQLMVTAGDIVKTGDIVAKLSSQKEDADFEQVNADAESARQQYLFDEQDDTARKSVKSATIALAHAKAAVDQRYIRASADGRVSDIHTSLGTAISAGTQLMNIIKPGTMPEEWAYLPAADLPRIKSDMLLQVGIDGFNKKRPKLKILSISNDAVGAAEIRREVGQQLADTLKLPNDGASYIVVKARFENDTFFVGKKEFRLHEGMSTKAEIMIESKPFFASIFPLFEKYFD